MRELARRSGVSPSQLSRIESGEVSRPSIDTLAAIARALGRHPSPLLVLAGHLEGEAGKSSLTRLLDSILVDIEEQAEMSDVLPDFLSSGESDLQAQGAEMLFGASGSDLLGHGFDRSLLDEAALEDLLAVTRAWPALSQERRHLMVLLVADQEVLSSLERMPSASERDTFEIHIQRTPEGDHE